MPGENLGFIITSMLECLHLKNVVLVKDMSIDFKSGFNVITGETGAGKSLVIKSLECLAGAMASESYIYPNETMALMEATFVLKNPPAGISEFFTDDRLTVSRRIYKDRPTVNKLNFESVSLKTLKDVMSHVMFITTQHHVLALMDQSNHMALFDQFIGNDITVLKAKYSLQYKEYLALKQQVDGLNSQSQALTNEINELSVLIDDIDAQQFSVEEEDELLMQQKKCQALHERRELVGALISDISNAKECLHYVDQRVTKLNEISQKKHYYDALSALDALEQLNQTALNERMDIEYLESIDIDDINQRLAIMFQYKVKYCVNSLAALLELRDHSQQKLGMINQDSSEKDALTKQLLTSYRNVVARASELSALREKHRAAFEYVALNQMKELGMPDATFSLEFDALDTLNATGQDAISFLFSANPNMPKKPIKKVASGGELSRVMLSLLVVTNGVLKQPLVVFDEIDVGIGGMTANTIGTLLQKMSAEVQLVSVTHLPQIARCADHHFTITKTTKDGQTCVSMNELNKNDVSIELQRMVGGDIVASLIR